MFRTRLFLEKNKRKI